jgi:radical SAM superfamily enzyme YgiQ (UPF0313 family)
LTDILLITPPFTQLNTPYPATAYLKAHLNSCNIKATQVDLGLEVILEMFSKNGLKGLLDFANSHDKIKSKNAKTIYKNRDKYYRVIDESIAYLQGSNKHISSKICNRTFLPEASRFNELKAMQWILQEMEKEEMAKYLTTLFLEDLSDFITECVDPDFGFSRYAERIGRSANSFDELNNKLDNSETYIDKIYLDILVNKIVKYNPKTVGFTVPFPGNIYSAFRCAKMIRQKFPNIKTVMGGGFASTELRSLSDIRVFDYFDFICLDDGEVPMELIVNALKTGDLQSNAQLKRTFLRKDNSVYFNDLSPIEDCHFRDTNCPDYSDLLNDKYISVIEIANPMHSLWSDGRWNKLTMAHGCYWRKCSFCDTSLSYIKDYQPLTAKQIVDRMEKIISQTGETGFHFVDEAAPPALMKDLAVEIIKRKLDVRWWTNIRFEKSFTIEVCQILAESGCIAVAGGLEVASDRLLKLINKGVTVEQVAKVTANLTDAGIMVHAYLMYGFPSQTIQETIDSLEMVRQMFEQDLIQSGFWHQFALTAHSEIGLNPIKFGLKTKSKEIKFANNDIEFEDSTGVDHNKFSFGLKKSIYNFMHGAGFEMPLQTWFDFKVPKTQIKRNYINSQIE